MGIDTDATSVFSQTALLAGARNGHEAVVKLLLVVGIPTRNPGVEAVIMELEPADLNSKDMNGQTSLSVASKKSHKAVVKLLP